MELSLGRRGKEGLKVIFGSLSSLFNEENRKRKAAGQMQTEILGGLI
jgi:hypothetical protein